MAIQNRVKTKIALISSSNIVWIVIVTFVAAVVFVTQIINDVTQRHTVLSIDKIENRTGDKDGFSTEVYYIVSTDKGAYHIKTSGINAAPECAGIMPDSTYFLRTRGISIPFFGIYSCIIEKPDIR